MPVYEVAYKSWEGERKPLLSCLTVFPKYTYMQSSGKKKIFTAFMMGWFPFILFMIYIYVRVNVPLLQSMRIPVNSLPKIDGLFFMTFILVQLPFMFFFTLAFGPTLISVDLKNKAIPMILSKPINKWEYIIGKFMVLFIILSILSWVQGVILFVANTFTVPKTDPWLVNFWSDSLPVLFKMIFFALVIISTLDLMVLMFSSLTNTPSFASVAFIMSIIGLSVGASILEEILHTKLATCISPSHIVYIIGRYFFYQYLGTQDSRLFICSVFTMILIWFICIYVLQKKVKAFVVEKE